MKKMIMAALVLVLTAAGAHAGDSFAVGIRAGAATNYSSQHYEAFGDLYLNKLVSIGATAAFTVVDRTHLNTVRRDEAVPITALFKVHAPVPLINPYAGAGQAVIFHDKRGTKGSPVLLAGVDFSFSPTPLFLNVEYRRQFDDKLNIIAGGVGVKF